MQTAEHSASFNRLIDSQITDSKMSTHKNHRELSALTVNEQQLKHVEQVSPMEVNYAEGDEPQFQVNFRFVMAFIVSTHNFSLTAYCGGEI